MKKHLEIFLHFLVLGCISFGGPIAHLAYFHHHFVDKLKWLNQESYARIIALSQFLPGPGSSQVGFSIGFQRAGIGGGLAAFLGFSLPSFALMYAFARLYKQLDGYIVFEGALQGLKLLTAVVVADACYKMFNKFCKTTATRILCILSSIILILASSIVTQITVLCCAAVIGYSFQSIFLNQSQAVLHKPAVALLKRTRSNIALLLFAALLLLAALLNVFAIYDPSQSYLAHHSYLFAEFYQAGSLVFGGGHVVLPLLQEFFSNRIGAQEFLAGYAGAQAVPGPMFSFASFLGASLSTETPLIGAVLACIAIFLPGFLLIIGLYQRWDEFSQKPSLTSTATAVNAAVVGLLFSALYQPVFSTSLNHIGDFFAVALGWLCLYIFKLHIIILVIAYASFYALYATL